MNCIPNQWPLGFLCLCVVLVGCTSASSSSNSDESGADLGVDVTESMSVFPDIHQGGIPDGVGKTRTDLVDAIEEDGASALLDAGDALSSLVDAPEGGDPPVTGPGLSVEDFLALCQAPTFVEKEVILEVVYKENLETSCPFSMGDNLDPVPAMSSARVDITKELELPPDSFPCAVHVSVQEKNLYTIEDGLIFQLNDIILLSNSQFLLEDTVEMPGALSGLPIRRHDWEAVKVREYGNRDSLSHCLTATTPECITPVPHSQVSFVYESDAAVSQDLAYDMATTGNRTLTATLIGDDDPDDCQHSGFTATVEVMYLELSSE